MTDAQPHVRQRTVSVDELFSRLHDDRVDYTIGLPNTTGPEGQRAPDAMPAYAEVQAPPTLENPGDLQVAQEWLQAERQRLEAYTRSQFAAIQQQHQSLLAKQFRSEEALALRAQELNREMKFLASQAEALQSRAHQLAEREMALSAHMERLVSAEQDLFNNLQGDPEPLRVVLERL